MSYRLKIYGASKIEDWTFWRDRKGPYDKVEMVNRWTTLSLAAQGLSGKPNRSQSSRAWLIDFADIQRCDALFLLCPASDAVLKGALIEAGYALGLGKPIAILGDHPQLSSWQHHPMVKKFVLVSEDECQADLFDRAVSWLTEIGE